MRYLVALDGSEPGVGYDVTVPDLPGCTSAGDDLDEALRNAKEAISLHLEAMIADGEPVPTPSTEPAPPSAPGALIGFLEVDLHTPSTSNRATRLSVTIPEPPPRRISCGPLDRALTCSSMVPAARSQSWRAGSGSVIRVAARPFRGTAWQCSSTVEWAPGR